jgi:hypothetical protein
VGGHLEGRPGPGRGLLEDQRDVPACQPVTGEAQPLVVAQPAAQVDQVQEFLAGEVELLQEAASVKVYR